MEKHFKTLLIALILLPLNLFSEDINLSDQLFLSIRNGDLNQVKSIIDIDKNLINSRNRLYSTPLIVAASINKLEICNYLIDAGADINLENTNNYRAIHYAAYNNQFELVKKLVEKGAEIEVWNNRGRLPIHYAAYAGNIEMLEYFVKKGLKINTKAGDDGGTVLHFACNGKNLEMVKYLLNKGTDLSVVDNEGLSVLHWATSGGSIDIIKFLVEEKSMDIRITNSAGIGLFHSAAFGRNFEAIKYLIDKGFEVNEKFEDGQTVLHLACDAGDLEFVKYVIEQGADVNAIDNRGTTPLNNAAFSGNVDVVALLMDKGAVLAPKICKETACAESPTPLHNATWRSPNVVEYFISRNVDVNILDENHKSALHNAMQGDSIRSVKLLCDAKINVNQKDKNGMTALHYGVKRGKIDAIKLLLNYNPDLNIVDNSGRTALHYAAITGNTNVSELLLKNNAKINIKDTKGNTEVDLANYYGNSGVATILISKGGKSLNKIKDLKSKELALGESVIWYLDHSGYAIKTKNNLLIFDYWERQPLPENGCLNNGYINPEEIKDMNVTVFASHTHMDHFSQFIFDWKDKIKNINYVLGFEHNTDIDYAFIPARETKMVGDVKVTPVTSNDSGQGFYVEVDGVKIFHPGDHTNISRDMCPNYTGDIKFLTEMNKKTDIAFYPVTGCRFQDKVALNMGTEFALKTMMPSIALPMHGTDNEYEYKRIAEEFNSNLKIESFRYPLNRGDRFFYKNGDSGLAKKD